MISMKHQMQNIISVINGSATREHFQWLIDHKISRTEIENFKVCMIYISEKPCGWSGRKMIPQLQQRDVYLFCQIPEHGHFKDSEPSE